MQINLNKSETFCQRCKLFLIGSTTYLSKMEVILNEAFVIHMLLPRVHVNRFVGPLFWVHEVVGFVWPDDRVLSLFQVHPLRLSL